MKAMCLGQELEASKGPQKVERYGESMLLTKSVPSNGPEPSNQPPGALGVWGRKPQGRALPLSQGDTWMHTGITWEL